MVATERSIGRLPLVAFATCLGFWAISASSSIAQQAACTCPIHCLKKPKATKTQGPNPTPGFQGFGLGYHLGYGFGGKEVGFGHGPYALGVGAEGGYPSYGGPGYPHPAPVLSRALAIVPFCYFGGPGYPTPENPNFFGGTGALAGDQPVVTFESDPTMTLPESDYGQFTGSLPYAESAFAPYATMIGEYGTSNATAANPPATSPTNPVPPASDTLGMMFEPYTETGKTPGLKITSIAVIGVIGKAGLRIGDVLVSINGYVTQKMTDPEWIILNASPDKVLKMNVRFASDGKDHAITVQLP